MQTIENTQSKVSANIFVDVDANVDSKDLVNRIFKETRKSVSLQTVYANLIELASKDERIKKKLIEMYS